MASGGNTYFWSPSSGLNQNTISNPVANPTTTTIYTVTVASEKCKSTDTVVVNVQPIPVEAITPESTINIGQSIMLAVSPQDSGYTYLWTPATGLNCNNCPTPVASPTVTTTYFAITTDSIGCQTEDTVIINVTDICGQYFVPNAFSPNGDGHNDMLQVFGNGLCIQEMDFVIFDRWGEKIFESMSQENGWDGTYKGKKMNPDTYAYYFSATLINGNTIQKSGNVTLVR
jgi:gliding motility-associated-like protein